MRDKKIATKVVLEMIKNGQVTPQEGYQMLSPSEPKYSTGSMDIAVIGMSGRFPGAENLDEFWDNLKKGVDSIREIPENRWKVDDFYSDEIGKQGKLYCRYGGMLEDVDKFDPLFFGISPKEAEYMDPQQRLFLMEAWKAIEDAGYNPAGMEEQKCGVFAGVSKGDYDHAIIQAGKLEAQLLTGMQSSILPSRVSYYLNFVGPCISVDTACSSSLVAVHMAAQSILNGECEIALAGGVCVLTTPEMYIMASGGGMLCADGKCKAFDNEANGFVPGEGVGVVLLKPLKKAIDDCDHIYGVIKGSLINHDGKTNGITAPSVHSQMNLETEVYEKYSIDPNDIGYVEAHGTGTKLGDPIEWNALTNVFENYTSQKGYCAVGSVKTNIGHGITSAGIAAFIKTMLCLNNNQLVPSLHFHNVNEFLHYENSPFYVNTELKEWGREGNKKHMAAISSFGLSGTNCHMVIEEAPKQKQKALEDSGWKFVPLSAKSTEALKRMANNLLVWMKSHEGFSFEDFGYTLINGRCHFPVRVVFIVRDQKELETKLQDYLDNRNSAGTFFGDLNVSKLSKEELTKIRKEINRLKNSLEGEKYTEDYLKICAENYVKGFEVNEETLFCKGGNHISLPTYSFEKERYWAESKCKKEGEWLHPLIEKNVSTLFEQAYSSFFTGQEFFLDEHRVAGKKVLPAVAYLELARVAGELAGNRKVAGIQNIVWLKKIQVDAEGIEVKIRLIPNNQNVEFEVVSGKRGSDSFTVHCKGMLLFSDDTEIETAENMNLAPFENMKVQKKKIESVYNTYQKMGIEFGPKFHSISYISFGEQDCYAQIHCEKSVKDAKYMMYPPILDGALQIVIGLSGENERSQAFLPFSMESIKIFGKLPETCFVHVTKNVSPNAEEKSFNIEIADITGKILAKIDNYCVKEVAGNINKNENSVLTFRKDWKEKNEQRVVKEEECRDTILVFGQDDDIYKKLKKRYCNANLILVTEGTSNTEKKERYYEANFLSTETTEDFVAKLFEKYQDINHIIYLWNNENAEESGEDAASLISKSLYPIFYACQRILRNRMEKKKFLFFIYQGNEDYEQCINDAMEGFFKTVRLENPMFICKAIGNFERWNADTVCRIIANEFSEEAERDTVIRYQNAKRLVQSYNEVALDHNSKSIWREKGVYLITGGAGGLGLIYADYIASKVHANIILTGRSELSKAVNEKIEMMQKMGSCVRYIRSDVTDFETIKKLIKSIKEEFKTLNGIIHSAGVIEDDYVINKRIESIRKVISPKVIGSINLDEATKDCDLDFFVMFSSTAAVYGNPGQCDYAFANAFMVHFSEYRENLRLKGLRSGKTLTIDWPLWKDGNMTVDKESQKELLRKVGMVPLSTAHGIRVMEDALCSNLCNVSVIEGKAETIKKSFEQFAANMNSDQNTEDEINSNREEIYREVKQILRKIISNMTDLPEDKIKEDVPFEAYGIDSVMIVAGNRELEKAFGNVSKTLFFECQNMKELADYFSKNYAAKVVAKMQDGLIEKNETADEILEVRTFAKDVQKADDEIAIIGMSGKYPMADDINEFWTNLKQGKDCITEIPNNRWDYKKFYKNETNDKGVCKSKWGGFISDFDKFDALFFHISPKDAEIMDPQERLFLETSWKVIEDAGYRLDDLRTNQVGVFVGAMYGQYQMYGAEETVKGNPIALNSSFSSIANRVSYTFDFHGPSICLDTMCSSSLTAIHLACESIKRGESDLAIAGGVNLSIHPSKYQLLGQGNFLDDAGRCCSFGDGGNGYVPGEGVGAVLLKPLSKAIKDGDHIYGVISGSAINHGGKTNGYTVPNPNAQAAVIKKALESANVNPKEISYVEAHGTGTALGDPIEITGLTKAYEEYCTEKQYCSIGSVKSNIGHLESAAGISGLTKVLLQMKYKKLVPSIHSKVLNPNISFENTPFYVQQSTCDWRLTSKEQNKKRTAAISAFGAGGSNAHIILREYAEEGSITNGEKRNVFLLSAKKEDELIAYAKKYIDFIRFNEENDVAMNLENISYTLQTGREFMNYRLAIVVSTIKELEDKLKNFCSGDVSDPDIFVGAAGSAEKAYEKVLYNSKRDMENMRNLANLWIADQKVDWKILYQNENGLIRKASLPSYPFNGKRYWFDSFEKSQPKISSDKESILAELDAKAAKYCGNEVALKIIDDSIALVTMQDRENKNMFSENIIAGLMSAFEKINSNELIKAVIVTGYDHVFSMGGTQDQLNNIANQKNNFTDVPFMYTGLLKCKVPVIAAMQGHAVGGGMLFGLYADIVIMSEEATYCAVFTKYGFTPGMGATYIIQEKFGMNIATEMMYTAKYFSGEELKNRGATVLFRKGDEVLPEALYIARMLAEKPRYTLEALKNDMSARILSKLPEVLEREVRMHEKTFVSSDTKKRIAHYYNHTDCKTEEKVQSKEDDLDIEKILEELETGEINIDQAIAYMPKASKEKGGSRVNVENGSEM